MTRQLLVQSWDQHALVFGVGLPELLILLVLAAVFSVVPLALL